MSYKVELLDESGKKVIPHTNRNQNSLSLAIAYAHKQMGKTTGVKAVISKFNEVDKTSSMVKVVEKTDRLTNLNWDAEKNF